MTRGKGGQRWRRCGGAPAVGTSPRTAWEPAWNKPTPAVELLGYIASPQKMALRNAAALLTLAATADAHGALVSPPPRNAIDRVLAPWNGPVPAKTPTVESKTGWCPVPDKDGKPSGQNGQACFCTPSPLTAAPLPAASCALEQAGWCSLLAPLSVSVSVSVSAAPSTASQTARLLTDARLPARLRRVLKRLRHRVQDLRRLLPRPNPVGLLQGQPVLGS